MKTKYISIFIFAFPMLWSCSEVRDWSDPADEVAPGPLSNVAVENRNGAVKFTFDLPEDGDLLGAKAVYRFGKDGDWLESYASAYVDTLVIDGFPDTDKREVKLYAIDKSMNLSAPVVVEVEPKTPPVLLIRESMEPGPDFGGVRLAWNNEYNADIAMDLYMEVDGEWQLYGSHYSSKTNGFANFRGLEAVETNFKVTLRDRWDNYAEPLTFTATPAFESYLPGKDENGEELYHRYQWNSPTSGNFLYRGDICNTGQTGWSAIYDRVVMSVSNWLMADDNFLHKFTSVAGISPESLGAEDNTTAFPVYLTVDISKPARLSRFKWYNRYRPTGSPLAPPTPLSFELWGSLERPKDPEEIGDGGYLANWKYWTAWDFINGSSGEGFKGEDTWKKDWIRLGTYKLELESGAKYNGDPITPEEIAYLNGGVDWNIDPEYTGVPVRYLRFVFHEFSDRRGHLQIGELELYGDYDAKNN